MPKADGTPTASERREGAMYAALAAAADRVDAIRERFAAQGFDIGSRVSMLDLDLDTAEAILDRLEVTKR